MKKWIALFLMLFVIDAFVFAQIDTTDEPLIFTPVDVDAEFPGGMEELIMFVCMNVEYPEQARNAKVEGTVNASFCIDRDGSVSNITILKDMGYGCGNEVVKMLKSMPRWKPAKVRGKNVRSEFYLPVTFTLSDDEDMDPKEKRCRAQAQLYSKSVSQDERTYLPF